MGVEKNYRIKKKYFKIFDIDNGKMICLLRKLDLTYNEDIPFHNYTPSKA